MSIFAYDIITTRDAKCTSTGLITTGYAITDAERTKLSAASLGGRVMPRILCTAVAGSGSATLLSFDYSLDGGTRWVTGQAFSVAVSGTGEKQTAASEITCLIPKSITNVRWSTGTETLGADDSLTLVLQLICEI